MSIGSFVVLIIAAIAGVFVNIRKYGTKQITKRYFIINTLIIVVFVIIAGYFLLANS